MSAGNETQVCYSVSALLRDAPSLGFVLLILQLHSALARGLTGVFWVKQSCIGGVGTGGNSVPTACVFSTASV